MSTETFTQNLNSWICHIAGNIILPERLYNLWKGGVLDFKTLATNQSLATTGPPTVPGATVTVNPGK